MSSSPEQKQEVLGNDSLTTEKTADIKVLSEQVTSIEEQVVNEEEVANAIAALGLTDGDNATPVASENKYLKAALDTTKSKSEDENNEDTTEHAMTESDTSKPNDDMAGDDSIAALVERFNDFISDPNHAHNSILAQNAAAKLNSANASSSSKNQKSEADTPRLPTYIKLHNEMMTSKCALTSDQAEQTRLFNHATHLARTLLAADEKHGDLPLVMEAHACLVLGATDEPDCVDLMYRAMELVDQAIDAGLLPVAEGAEMRNTCALLMGLKRAEVTVVDDGEDGESESEDDEEGEDGEGDDDTLP